MNSIFGHKSDLKIHLFCLRVRVSEHACQVLIKGNHYFPDVIVASFYPVPYPFLRGKRQSTGYAYG